MPVGSAASDRIAPRLRSTDQPSITVHRDGHFVSRLSDYIIYSVEAEYIARVVQEYGPCERSFYIMRVVRQDAC